jgi:hypothetical protein
LTKLIYCHSLLKDVSREEPNLRHEQRLSKERIKEILMIAIHERKEGIKNHSYHQQERGGGFYRGNITAKQH